jgi:hypothetical protein
LKNIKIIYTVIFSMIIIIVLLCSSYFSKNGNPIKLMMMENKVKDQLTQQGYTKAEITFDSGGVFPSGVYRVLVRFKDEPDASYRWFIQNEKPDRIMQDCGYYNENGEWLSDKPERKHREKYCPSDRQIEEWLVQKGYKKSNIASYLLLYPPPNSNVTVIFNVRFIDEYESDISYDFVQEAKTGKIMQVCGYYQNGRRFVDKTQGKHSEKSCIPNTPFP